MPGSMLDNPFAAGLGAGYDIGGGDSLSSGDIGAGGSLGAAFSPVTGGSSYADPTSSGVNWDKLSKALTDLGKQDPASKTPQISPAQILQAQSGAHDARAPASIGQLFQMMNTRTQDYLQAAMNPQKAAPVQPPRTQGLLGM
jgi:hypothetical protein